MRWLKVSWMSALYETYEYLWDFNLKNPGSVKGLLPPAIIEQQAQLTVVLDENSKFVRAEMVDKEDNMTKILVTEKSASRTSGAEPHVLFDNLWYIGGDIQKYIESGSKNTYHEYFLLYIKQLNEWNKSSYSNIYINIVYSYLKKECLINDLIKYKILNLKENNLIDDSKKYSNVVPSKFFVRFAIEIGGNLIKLWEDEKFLNDYSKYYIDKISSDQQGFCYVSGKIGHLSEIHGKYIRFPGDGAKLISSNDNKNYTFRGRFYSADEACGISYEVSEKAHSALRYLIKKQGYVRNKFTVLAWSTKGDNIIRPMVDTDDLGFLSSKSGFSRRGIDTNEYFADELKRAIKSYKADLKDRNVNLISIDSATPGRMSILYYSEKYVDNYLSYIEKWHSDLAWEHYYKRDENEKLYSFIGAPSSYDIVLCAFGSEQNKILKMGDSDKFLNQQLRRLLPCIVDGARLPSDFVNGAYLNAVNPQSMEWFNWQKCLSVACSLIRKYYIDREGVEYNMTLDTETNDRSYLYGRLLAVADKLESSALYKKDINRLTSAKRFMNAFSKRPFKTWKTIELSLSPYWNIIEPGSRYYYSKILDDIMAKFKYDDFGDNKQLDTKFLLGFHCQLSEFNKKSDKKEDNGGLND